MIIDERDDSNDENLPSETLVASVLVATTFSAAAANKPAQEEWVDLFNGKDLSNWTIKLKGYPAGIGLSCKRWLIASALR